MIYEKTELLSNMEIQQLISSSLPNERAKIIANKLKNLVIIKENTLYELDRETITYTYKKKNIRTHLTTLTSILIEQSFTSLEIKDREIITLKYSKYFKVFENTTIDKYVGQLENQLTNDKILFDSYVRQLHFKNGYLDISTGKFQQRTQQQYITKYINGYEYKSSTKEQRNEVMKEINKIFPLKADRDSILIYISSGLSSEGTKDQDVLFLTGKGSSGKSFIMNLTKEAIDFYFVELQSDAFKSGSDKKDKILSTFRSNPHALITWVNELSHEKLDTDMFKKFAEGSIQCTLLYENGSHDFKHQSKIILTSQRIPNINMDTGVIRRLLGYEPKSNFTDNKDDVDEKNHIYAKEKDLHLVLKQKGLLSAWIDILITYCQTYMKGKKIEYSKNFESMKNEMIGSNDTIQDFIDGMLIITNKNEDRIGKDDLRNVYTTKYKDKFISPANFISLMKDKNILYSADCRVNHVKGCFIGIRFRDTDVDDDDYNDLPFDHKIKNLENEIYARQTELNKLKQSKIDKDNKMLKDFEIIQKIEKLRYEQKQLQENMLKVDNNENNEKYYKPSDEYFSFDKKKYENETKYIKPIDNLESFANSFIKI